MAGRVAGSGLLLPGGGFDRYLRKPWSVRITRKIVKVKARQWAIATDVLLEFLRL